MIINKEHLEKLIYPIFYIGSKKDITKFPSYWSNCKQLRADITKLGLNCFDKLIIEKVNFNKTEELLNRENYFQKLFNVKESLLFYNKAYACGPWYSDTGKHTQGTVWVNNTAKNYRIKKEKLPKYLSKGFTLGRANGNYNKYRIYIHKNEVIKSVFNSDLPKFLLMGWNIGRLKGNQLHKKWIHLGDKRKLIKTIDYNSYLNLGWLPGWKNI